MTRLPSGWCVDHIVHRTERVAEVQRQVRDWHNGSRKTRMCTARPSWMTMSLRHGLYKKTHTNINIDLPDVLEVDADKRTVRVEPLATMGQVCVLVPMFGMICLPTLNAPGERHAAAPGLDAGCYARTR